MGKKNVKTSDKTIPDDLDEEGRALLEADRRRERIEAGEVMDVTEVLTLPAISDHAKTTAQWCFQHLDAYPDALNDDPLGRKAYAANLLKAIAETERTLNRLKLAAVQIATTPAACGYAEMGTTEAAKAVGTSRQTVDKWRNKPLRMETSNFSVGADDPNDWI